MKKGRITKLTGGLYTVETEDLNRYNVKGRGVLRHQNRSPKVGDLVMFDNDFITEIFDRENDLVRPPVANVDQAILINAAKEPDFSFYLLDRFLVLIEKEHVRPVIVVSKIDLLNDDELNKLKEKLTYYETFYDVYYVSVKDETSLKPLKGLLKDSISVFAGQTGAGKSSLLNALDIKLNLETGEISKALGRGRHTTRHSELIHVYEGLVADTPGFSKLDFYDIDIDLLPELYVDFFEKSAQCKFRACTHLNEPKCAVKKAVETLEIPQFRYDNYRLIYEEIKNQKKKY